MNRLLRCIIAWALLLTVASPWKAAAEEVRPQKAPNGDTITFEGKKGMTISVRNAKGEVIFAEGVDSAAPAEPIIWNREGTCGAFSLGTPFLMRSYVLARAKDRYRLRIAADPARGWDNFHASPKKWKGDVLTVEIDGPHAGKADGYRYAGYLKIRMKGPDFEPIVIKERSP